MAYRQGSRSPTSGGAATSSSSTRRACRSSGPATEAVVTRLFHALGYYVPQLNIATLRRENLAIAPDATVRMPNGSRRRMHHSDLV